MSHKTKLHNFPAQLTSFIGRESEIAEIVALLGKPDCRLLTLVGPGGIGKTRLALEVAMRQAEAFAHGAYFVPLAPLKSAVDIVTTVINVLGIRVGDNGSPREELVTFLGGRNLLLLLDNFEHVLEGADLVTEIAAAAPACKFLITSRASLNLQFEWVWHVKGMLFPEDETGKNVDAYSAVELFIDRAQQVRRDFSGLDEQRYVVEICQLVEGNPLAIELAATRVKTLSCADILAEIQQSLSFLTDPRRDVAERHHSMRAVFDWSWQLLSPEEREIFPRLSVFRGGFTSDAAEAVTGASVHNLSQLVERSLVRRMPLGRYDVHELLRQFGEAELKATGKAEETQDAHSTFYAAFMYERAIDIKGRRQREGLDEIEADLENLRAVWERAAIQQDYATLDQMIEGFYWFRNFRGLYREVVQFAWDHLAPKTDEEAHPTAMKILIRIGDYREGSDLTAIERALESARKHDDEHEIAFCILILAWYLIDQTTRTEEGVRLLEERLATHRHVDDTLYIAEYHYAIGTTLNWQDKFDLSDDFLKQSFELHIKSGNPILAAWSHCIQANNARRGRGQFDVAMNHVSQARELWHEAGGYPHGETVTTVALSQLAIRQGQFDRAVPFAEKALQTALDHNYMDKAGDAREQLVWIAFFKGDYERAAQLHQQNISIYNTSIWMNTPPVYGDWVGSFITCGSGHFDDARKQVQRALRFWTIESPEPNRMAQCLPVYAAILAHDGQYVRATELLALSFSHSTDGDGRLASWRLLPHLRDDLYNQLGDEAYESAWKRGETLDVRRVAADLLDMPQIVHDTPQLKANRDLPEPLSPRELEVLQYLAARRTNREIADELVIAVGTVKTHVYHICAKLSATDRLEAVRRARELGLL